MRQSIAISNRMILNDINQEGLSEGLFNSRVFNEGKNREDKSVLKKSREAMERLEGEPSGFIDI